MNKKLKKIIITAAIAVAACGAVWGGLTIARNAQRGDVNVYSVSDFAMTNYWGDTSSTNGMVTTDKLQKIYVSSTQTVSKVYVTEGQTVKKGAKLLSYDSSLSQAEVERAQIQYERQSGNLEDAKTEFKLLQKAKNKEELKLELNKLQTQLDAEKKKYDQDPSHPYDGDNPVTEALLGTKTVENSSGGKETVYYYAWTSKSTLSGEHLLTGFGGRLRATESTSPLVTNIVLVQRTGDKIGGSIQANWGVKVTDTYTKTGETTYEVTVDVQLVTNLPDYEDPGHTYNSETIQKLEQQVARAQELMDSSMTRQELDVAIGTKYKEIGQLETSLKVAKLDLEKKQSELGDGNVYAEFDGTVKVVRDATEAFNSSEAVVELSGGGGYYVTGTLSEMDLGSVKIGDTVQISSWRTGVSCEGEIVSIDDYPTQNGSNWGDGNSNVSYYPFKVFVSEDANLQPNDYVEMQYQKTAEADSADSLYLESFFLRSENGKSYVMVRGENDKLEKRWVQTGRDLWGSYTQIRGGLTLEDYVAFPYGRDVVEGAHTQEATADQLYNGM